MKVKSKIYLPGILLTIMVLSSATAFAAVLTKTIDVIINDVNIAVDDKTIDSIGDNYILEDGKEIPMSLTYKGMAYIPISKAADLINKEAVWDNELNVISINEKVPTYDEFMNNNSRQNPAGVGDKLTLHCTDIFSGKYSIELTLTEVIRGQKALELLKAQSEYNEDPIVGKEYVILQYKINVLSSENDTSVSFSSFDFESVSSKGVVSDSYLLLTGIEPSLEMELYPDAEFEGYTYIDVDLGDEALVRYLVEYGQHAWFKLQ